MISDYIEIHKKAIVNITCLTIVIICIITILVLSLPPSYSKELKEIDLICDTNQVKADSMLYAYQKANKEMDSNDKWFCRFLSLKSDVKKNKDMVDYKEVSAILEHFEKEDDKQTLQQVYYYAGCAYHIVGNAQQAINILQKGLAIIPKKKGTEDLRALYYYMLGGIFSYQYLHEEAFDMQSKALELHKMRKDYKRIMYDYISIAWTYKAFENYDAAISCLEKAKNISKKEFPDNSLAEIYSQIADTYYQKGQYKIAKANIEQALDENSISDKHTVYSIAAHIYDALGEENLSELYCRKLLQAGTTYNRQFVYKFFAKRCKEQGYIDSAYTYSVLYANITDTIMQENASEFSARANAEFNYKNFEKENKKLRSTSTGKNIAIYISLMLLFSSIGYNLIFRRKAKKNNDELFAILKEVKKRSNQTIEEYQRELREIRKRLSSMNSEKTKMEKQYKDKEAQLEKVLQESLLLKRISNSNDRIWKETECYKRLKYIYECNMPVPEGTIDWRLLEETLFRIYPTFKENLWKLKKMKAQAYHVCLLVKGGFSVSQIAYFTNKTDDGINSTRRRLYENNLGKKGKPSEWDEFIRSL